MVVLGAGNVGWNAAWMAAGLEAEVHALDRNVDRLRWVDQMGMGRIVTLASNRGQVERSVAEADLVIGAVLVAGGRAPVIVTEDMVAGMLLKSAAPSLTTGLTNASTSSMPIKPIVNWRGGLVRALGTRCV